MGDALRGGLMKKSEGKIAEVSLESIPSEPFEFNVRCVLTRDKVIHIRSHLGHEPSGYVLRHRSTGGMVIVEQSAVRWLNREEAWELMHPRENVLTLAEGQKKALIEKQSLEVMGPQPKVTCGCGYRLSLRLAYNCFHCKVWFCPQCAPLHFGPRGETRDERRTSNFQHRTTRVQTFKLEWKK